jgi:single-stranded DNA-binding protein
MTIFALVSGSLFGEPNQKVSKAGRSYASSTLKVRDGDATQWIRVTVFSESAQAELMRLNDGDAISVQEVLKAETYTASVGSIKISLGIVADHVLALRQPPRERKPKATPPPDTRSKQERQRGSWESPADGPNDAIPW